MSSVGFTTNARLLNQLGEQLIKSEDIALLELIKNAYDADATFCHVTLEHISDPQRARITIRDDGCGMDSDIIRRAWLVLGTSYKHDLASDASTKRTPKFKRIRLGEKGIGRLGVHRLGNKIELFSRRESREEVHLQIDWRRADEVRLIEEVPVSLSSGKPQAFHGKDTGTYIVISDLKGTWTRRMVRDVARTMSTLNSPFKDSDSFVADLQIVGTDEEKGWLEGIMSLEEVRERSLYSFDVVLQGNRITSFHYEFTPWRVLDKLRPRTVSWDETNPLARLLRNGKDQEELDISDIGEVRFQGLVFDLDPTILKFGIQDKSGFKEYLQENGGIRIYRDNMRVLNYGEKGVDWLDLNFRRVNQPGSKISNNVIIAAVELKRECSEVLVEKANREGFLQNDAFERLQEAVLFALKRVETERNFDKENIREAYKIKAERVPLRASMSELRKDIEEYVGDKDIRRRMQRCLDRVESDYEAFGEALMKSAGAGLNLTMVIHQMEKIIKNIRASFRRHNHDFQNVVAQVDLLARLVEGYSILVRNTDRKPRNLIPIIEQSIFNAGFRFSAHKISIDKAYAGTRKAVAVCTEGHAINALLNLFDNSIWWLGYSKTVNPKIYIDVIESSEYPKSIAIVVADNGPGFAHAPYEDLTQPFVTFKPNGMGIGLHLTKEIMTALGGRVVFPNPAEVGVPDQYVHGAVIALVFPKEK